MGGYFAHSVLLPSSRARLCDGRSTIAVPAGQHQEACGTHSNAPTPRVPVALRGHVRHDTDTARPGHHRRCRSACNLPLQGTRFGRARDAWRSAGRMARAAGRGGCGRRPDGRASSARSAWRAAGGTWPWRRGGGCEAAPERSGMARQVACLGTALSHRRDAWTTVAGR